VADWLYLIIESDRDKETIVNEDQIRGRADQVKGKVKEVVGNAVGDKAMEKKGKLRKIKGKSQAAYGDLKEEIKKSI
jgi:uncharacterized protein YjbJ (UPF0337 family)